MIPVERLNGEEVFINPDQVKTVAKRPDTVLTVHRRHDDGDLGKC